MLQKNKSNEVTLEALNSFMERLTLTFIDAYNLQKFFIVFFFAFVCLLWVFFGTRICKQNHGETQKTYTHKAICKNNQTKRLKINLKNKNDKKKEINFFNAFVYLHIVAYCIVL